MTNDEIIKFLQSKQLPQCGDREYTADEEYEAYQMAIKALEQTTWIPVSERLPEDNTEVLVTTYTTYDEKVRTTRYQDKEHGFLCGLVKAWMPLPEPYKAESEE